ncbi:class I SAM-dependent methyltransferase [Planosporangium sp. 12N6]|uniref:class I SAM-dependent methyltransferase n=1 Tax=Planosporangium spinosum TaxID=3402278 RepID=UPI003CE743C1
MSPLADQTESAFVRAHTRLAPAPYVPEVLLHLADDAITLWELTEAELRRGEQPPPFWAFAWAGGQALARYILDHPDLVGGRTVFDLAAGSGLVAIAAVKAGAAVVTANEIDPLAVAAVAANAQANGVEVTTVLGDVLSGDAGGAEVVLAGDVFYSRSMANRVLPFLRRAAARGAHVLVGDPGRAYLPRDRFTAVTVHDVPVIRSLENSDVKTTTVWQVPAAPD